MSATIKPFKDWTKKAALRLIRGAPVKPIERWDIKAGDLVHIRSGRSAGAQGRVKEVLRDKNRVLVENANMVKRHVRATATAPGGVLAKESPVHYSNVALVDPQTGCVGGGAVAPLHLGGPPFLSFLLRAPNAHTLLHARARAHTHPLPLPCSKPTRVTRVRGPDGLQRISKRSGVAIPVNAETLKARRAERPPEPGPKDTPASAVARVTYAPDAALLPYLAAGGALWEIAGSRGAALSVCMIMRPP